MSKRARLPRCQPYSIDPSELAAALAAEPEPADPVDLTRPRGEAEPVVLEAIRSAGATHLVPAHGEAALCGALLSAGWAPGSAVSCGVCAAALPPEADVGDRSPLVDASRARA